MSTASEFVLREVVVGLVNGPTDSKSYEIVAQEDWQLALETRERWLKGEEETLTLAQLKEELRAELGWKS